MNYSTKLRQIFLLKIETI